MRLTSHFEKLKDERQDFYLTLEELNQILIWKLRSQLGRQLKRREVNTDKNVLIITKAAFSVTHDNKDFETILKIKLLSTLAGVEIPVASAILTLCYPKEYSVIDVRNWRQVYKTNKRKTNYTAKEYTDYLNKIKQWSKEYEVTPQEIDIAIWRKDTEISNKATANGKQ